VKDVEIFKSSASKNLSNFKLIQISEIYNNLENSSNELVFLDENLNEIKVNSITKVPYSGKIFDVDVSNDIVLIRRNNGTPVW